MSEENGKLEKLSMPENILAQNLNVLRTWIEGNHLRFDTRLAKNIDYLLYFGDKPITSEQLTVIFNVAPERLLEAVGTLSSSK